ncbi:Hypothetical protein PBC10988_3190 [Planctomycetales bacterium 10988]|nr:Hypothetical protein PBC10988_3190 [Planctomycetales bacterium 10988]
MNIYWLSLTGIDSQKPIENNFYMMLVHHEQKYRLAFLVCREQDDQEYNREYHDFFMECKLQEYSLSDGSRDELRVFLENELCRQNPDSESWVMYQFGDDSYLIPFDSDEIKIGSAGKYLGIDPNISGSWIQRPSSFALGEDASNLSSKVNSNFTSITSRFEFTNNTYDFSFAISNDGTGDQLLTNLPFTIRLADFISRKKSTSHQFGFIAVGPMFEIDWIENNINFYLEQDIISLDFILESSVTFEYPLNISRTTLVRFTGDNLAIRIPLVKPELLPQLIALNSDAFSLEVETGLITSLIQTTDKFRSQAADTLQDDLVYPIRPEAETLGDQIRQANPFCLRGDAAVVEGSGGGILQFEDGGIPTWHESIQANPSLFIYTQVESQISNGILSTFEIDLEGLGINKQGTLALQKAGTWVDSSSITEIYFPVVFQLTPGVGNPVFLEILITYNLLEMRMTSTRFIYRFIQSQDFIGQGSLWYSSKIDSSNRQIDFSLFALEGPFSTGADRLSDQNQTGEIDFQLGELTLAPGNLSNKEDFRLLVPGGEYASANSNKRFRLKLQQIESGTPLIKQNTKFQAEYFRISRQGVSVFAELLEGSEIELISDSNTMNPLHAKALALSKEGEKSLIKLNDNSVEVAQLYARMQVPGTKNLQSEIFARFVQEKVHDRHTASFQAYLGLAGNSSEPKVGLSNEIFNATISNPRFWLQWNNENWDVGTLVDATLEVHPSISMSDGMTELKGSNSIIVKDLDLVKLHGKTTNNRTIELELKTRKFAFSLFDAIGIELDKVVLKLKSDKINFFSEKATLDFNLGGGIRGGVRVGSLDLECSKKHIEVSRITGAGVSLNVPGLFNFDGDISWGSKEQSDSHYIALNGILETTGLRLEGLLIYESNFKRNGRRADSIVAVGGKGNLNYMLLQSLWWQTASLGAGYNSKLGNLSQTPTNNEILRKIDNLEPIDPENWDFVSDEGTYATVVGKAIFTSQPAGPRTICGFVIWSVLSLDSQSRFIAAGKLWLFSSQRFAEQNAESPSLIAAMHFDPRSPSLSLVAKTNRAGKIESMPHLQQILNQVDAQLTIRLDRNLLDIYLERLKYRQEFIRNQFEFEATWRFVIYDTTILQYARAKVSGSFGDSLKEANAGISFKVDLYSGLDYGGLYGRNGLLTWGRLDAQLTASIEAFCMFEIRTPHVKWRGWKSTVEWRTHTKKFPFRGKSSLGFTGEYAFEANHSISVGGRIYVHFHRHICGNEVNISPELKFQPSVLKKARDQTRAFETRIDSVGRPDSLQVSNAKLNKLLLRLDRLNQTESRQTEEWILVPAAHEEDNSRWVILPTFNTEWFVSTFLPPEQGQEEQIHVDFLSCVEAINLYHDQDLIETIRPAWDQRNWRETPIGNDANDEAIELYRLNAMLAETVPEQNSLYHQKMEEIERGKGLNEYEKIIDERPYKRLRDALSDEDRLTLPAEVYPFTYRPLSNPYFEKKRRMMIKRRQGVQGVHDGLTSWHQARGALLSFILAGLESGRGILTKSYISSESSYYTAYVRSSPLPDSANHKFKVVRDGEESDVDIISAHDPLLLSELRNKITVFRDCQEFHEFNPETSADPGSGEVVIKLPVDIRALFEPIKVRRGHIEKSYATNWFELVQFVRIIRGDSEIIADQVPLPANISRVTGSDEFVLLEPFVCSDQVKVDASQRQKVASTLSRKSYRLQIVPLGMESLPINHPQLKNLEINFPDVYPYLPGRRIFPNDLALEFDPFCDSSSSTLDIRLVHMTSEVQSLRLETATLTLGDFELFYLEDEISNNGFYSQTIEEDGSLLTNNQKKYQGKGRESRVAGEASDSELRSTHGLTPITVIYHDADNLGVSQYGLESNLIESTLNNSESPSVKLTLIQTNRVGFYRLGSIDPNKVYNFYIRAAGSSDLVPVRHLPVFVSRGTIDRDGENLPLAVPGLEMVKPVGPELIDFNLRTLSKKEATENFPYHQLIVSWTHLATQNQSNWLGGADLEVYLKPTGQTLLTQRIEVLEPRHFRISQKDFREPRQWQAILPERLLRSKSNARIFSNSSRKLFWDSRRWFYDETFEPNPNSFPRFENSPQSAPLKDLLNRIKNYKDAEIQGNYIELRLLVTSFWERITDFLADPQNINSKNHLSTIEEVRSSLLCLMAGLTPTVQDNTNSAYPFSKLLEEFYNRRDNFFPGDLSEQDTFEKQTDLIWARRLNDIVYQRLEFIVPFLDFEFPENDDFTVEESILLANEDKKNTYSQALGLPNSKPSLPYVNRIIDVLRNWIGLESPNLNRLPPEVRETYPKSFWFLERMLSRENSRLDWEDWLQGQDVAKRMHDPDLGDSDTNIVLKSLYDVVKSEPRSDEPIPIVYAEALQRILGLSTGTLAVSYDDKLRRQDNGYFQIRPHHSLTLEIGTEQDPYIKTVVSTHLSSDSPFIEQLNVNLENPTLQSCVSSFPAFLNLMERFGLAVDIALEDEKLGTQKQSLLVSKLKTQLEDYINDPNNLRARFVICRGKAPGRTFTNSSNFSSTNRQSSEGEFPFVKLIMLPEGFIADESFLITRGLKQGGVALDEVTIKTLRVVTDLCDALYQAAEEPLEIWLEQSGGEVISIPYETYGNEKKCTVGLTLPDTIGQNIGVNVRLLSRYQILAEWLRSDIKPQSVDVTQDKGIYFRPFRGGDEIGGIDLDSDISNLKSTEIPRKPILHPNRFEPVFTTALPPDAIDSRDNLLTSIETGFRDIGLRFYERAVNEHHIKSVLTNLLRSNIQKTSVTHFELLNPNDASTIIFPNELGLLPKHRPYFLEDSLESESHYQQTEPAKSSNFRSNKSSWASRKPRKIAHRPAFWLGSSPTEGELTIHFSRHLDLLTPAEIERLSLPIYFDVAGFASSKIELRQCPDLRYSYLVLYKIEATQSKQRKQYLPRRNLYAPLFEILLPLHPSHGGEDQTTAMIKKFSSEIESVGEEKPRIEFNNYPEEIEEGNIIHWEFGLSVPLKLSDDSNLTLSTDTLKILASRDGYYLGPYDVSYHPNTGS